MQVLLVEDNASDASLLMEFLSDKEGAPKVHWVTNGQDAMDYLFKRTPHNDAVSPDAILLDLGLPRISGYELLKTIKKDPQLARVPVIVLTTSRNPADQRESHILGAITFLSKPNNLKGYEDLVNHLMYQEFPDIALSCNNASFV